MKSYEIEQKFSCSTFDRISKFEAVFNKNKKSKSMKNILQILS